MIKLIVLNVKKSTFPSGRDNSFDKIIPKSEQALSPYTPSSFSVYG